MDINVANGNVAQNISSVSTKTYKEVLTKKTPYKVVKRIMDVLLSSIALVVLSPVFAIIAAAIKLESKAQYFSNIHVLVKMGKLLKYINLGQWLKMQKI